MSNLIKKILEASILKIILHILKCFLNKWVAFILLLFIKKYKVIEVEKTI